VGERSVVASVFPGYAHHFSSSKFSLGSVQRQTTEDGFDKIVGAHGVFAVDLTNGASWAIPNADAPSLTVPALTTDPDVHNNRALAYFSEAGLDMSQVSGVHVTQVTAGTVDALGGGDGPNGHFVAYNSILERTLDGILIPDSYAWVQFNANDQVVYEAAYWPDVPKSVIADAHSLQSVMANPGTRSDFLSRLPPHDDSEPQVVVHHSLSINRDSFQARAVVDIRTLGQRPAFRHFTLDGTEWHVPTSAAASSLPVPSRKQ
jgi:hypothetical protein